MAATVDPSFPLLPLASLVSAAMLSLILLSSFVRQNYSLGVTYLCFWLLLDDVTGGANYIIWSNNASIKYVVYCDIVTHLQVMVMIIRPMATFIITRRLYLVANFASGHDLSSSTKRRRNLIIELILGLLVPMVIAGPIYYVDQDSRFQVIERFGCEPSMGSSIFYILFLESWTIIPSILSLIFYYPRVLRIFRQQRKDINNALRNNTEGSLTHVNYCRILALASVDILLTLPIGIVWLVLVLTGGHSQNALYFYAGWKSVHGQVSLLARGTAMTRIENPSSVSDGTSGWQPRSIPYSYIESLGPSVLAEFYVACWTSPVLSFVIFALFGMTAEARASYWRVMHALGRWFGWKRDLRAGTASCELHTIEFSAPPQSTASLDAEMGSCSASDVSSIRGSRAADVKTAGSDCTAIVAVRSNSGDNVCSTLREGEAERDTVASRPEIEHDG